MYWRAKHFKQPQGENIDTDIAGTIKFVVAHEKRQHIKVKQNIPMWSPAHFVDGYRKKSNVTNVHWFVADVDDGTDYFTTCDKLKRADWLFFAHCTWSWSCNLQKFRVALPLQDPIPAKHWSVCWDKAADWFENLTGCKLDVSTKDSSRAYAVSAHEKRQLPPFIVNDGHHLNLLAHCKDEIEYQDKQQMLKTKLRARQAQLNASSNSRFQNQNNAINQQYTLTHSDKLALANRLGARLDGQYAKKMTCPQCQRQSLWFSLQGFIAQCNHKNSCGYQTHLKHLNT